MSKKLRPVKEVAAEYLEKPVSPATVWRWTTKGAGGRRLEATRVGGRLHTTSECFERFLHKVEPTEEQSDERTPEMKAKLEEAGIL